ncbi:DgyrCDS8300 [Dimorphilus gyrociliatus]|uniref:E3 ubiquitin-protein ligase n=1 Tax=Dimorphilus gyrociliatus TaxID=2664684 RepID=A0A7I8VYW9_9ANNE|nr:DgyrCDS8300 [Dimorphilus gyrociliatus]
MALCQRFISINPDRDMKSKFPVDITNHQAKNWEELKQMVYAILHQNVTNFYILKVDSSKNLISKKNTYALIFDKQISKDNVETILRNKCTSEFEMRLSATDLQEFDVLDKPAKYDINRIELRKMNKLNVLEEIKNLFGVYCDIESDICILKGGALEIRNAVAYLKDECPESLRNYFKRAKKRPLTNDSDSDDDQFDENGHALTFQDRNTKVFLYEGDLTKVNTDSVAISVGPNFEHSVGVASAVMNLAGPEARQACINKKSIRPGDVHMISVQTTMPVSYILTTNATLAFCHYTFSSPIDIIESCYKNCITEADKGNLKSVAFPLFGCGFNKLPVEEVVNAFLNGLRDSNSRLEEIHIVELETRIFNKLKSCIKIKLKGDVKPCQHPKKRKDSAAVATNDVDMELPNYVMKNGLNVVCRTGEILKEKSTVLIFPLLYGYNSYEGFPYDLVRFIGTYNYSKYKRILENMTPFSYDEFIENKFETALNNILTELDSFNNVTSVSLYPWTDKFYSLDMTNSIIKVFNDFPKPKNINIVTVLHEQRHIVQTFHQAIKRFKEPPQSMNEKCPICLDNIDMIYTTLPCSHTFCKTCLDQWLKGKGVCPVCKAYVAKTLGNQPEGQMGFYRDSTCLPGFENCGTIVIHYSFPSGIQGPQHPNAGVPYSGTTRQAYLPDNADGKEVLNLLKKAWDEKLLFTIGRSVTTGMDNSVIWNDVHHKTSRSGGPTVYGYPDPTYLNRVKEELRAKGIY